MVNDCGGERLLGIDQIWRVGVDFRSGERENEVNMEARVSDFHI